MKRSDYRNPEESEAESQTGIRQKQDMDVAVTAGLTYELTQVQITSYVKSKVIVQQHLVRRTKEKVGIVS